MQTRLTKKFQFSASFKNGERMIGHNYVFGVVTQALSEADEKAFENTVRRLLIDRIDSRDLGLNVEFLKNIEINELNLLKSFWKLLEHEILPLRLSEIFLEKDGRSQVALFKDA